jgi:hypothetical protein
MAAPHAPVRSSIGPQYPDAQHVRVLSLNMHEVWCMQPDKLAPMATIACMPDHMQHRHRHLISKCYVKRSMLEHSPSPCMQPMDPKLKLAPTVAGACMATHIQQHLWLPHNST